MEEYYYSVAPRCISSFNIPSVSVPGNNFLGGSGAGFGQGQNSWSNRDREVRERVNI